MVGSDNVRNNTVERRNKILLRIGQYIREMIREIIRELVYEARPHGSCKKVK